MKIVFLLALLAASAVSSFAQSTTGDILGSIQDSTGAFIADAKIEARNLETNAIKETTSSADGRFRISLLPAGRLRSDCGKAGLRQIPTRAHRAAPQPAGRLACHARSARDERHRRGDDRRPAHQHHQRGDQHQLRFQARRRSAALHEPQHPEPGRFHPRRSPDSSGNSGLCAAATRAPKARTPVPNGMRAVEQHLSDRRPGFLLRQHRGPAPAGQQSGHRGRSPLHHQPVPGRVRPHGRLGDEHRDQERHQLAARQPLLVPQRQSPERARNTDKRTTPAPTGALFRVENQFGGTFGGRIIKDKTFFFVSLLRWTDRRLGSGTTINGAPTEEGRRVLTQLAGTRPTVQALLENLPAGTPTARPAPSWWTARPASFRSATSPAPAGKSSTTGSTPTKSITDSTTSTP